MIQSGAEPFFLPGGPDGVLLVHGFTGCPADLLLLGEYLQAQGFTVLGVRLAGHGTTAEDMSHMVWENWYDSVRDGLAVLGGACEHISVVGHSMGGLLAIKAAAEHPVEKVALLATPIYLKDKRVPFVKILRFFIRRIHTGQQTYDVPQEYMQGYPEMPTKPIPSLLELIKLCKEDYLKKITAPTLIVQGEADHTVNPKSANYIYENLSNVPKQQKKILWLPKSRHVVTLGEEREKVFAACLEFFTKDLEETS